MIKVIIIDDQVILRESLKFIITQDQEMNVVGIAGNGLEALALCDEYSPDVVLMDIFMPICDGVKGTELIKSKYGAKIKVIILTTFGDDDNVSRALKKGADGYVLKDIKPEELILAIKTTAKGMNIIHREVYNFFANKLKQQPKDLKSIPQNIKLTQRELEITRLIVDGKANQEIAAILNLTEGSVKNAITNIFNKLKIQDRTQLAILAVKNKLI